MGLIPVIDGALRHFSAGGLYNGLVLLIDDETQTYWDHVSGEAVHGPSVGAAMQTFPLVVVNVREALRRWPDLCVAVSKPSLFGRFFGWFAGDAHRRAGRFPPTFKRTMGDVDDRLGAHDPGLGVMAETTRRFYPMAQLTDGVTDTIDGRALVVEHKPERGPPVARWVDDGTMPLQVLMRWYGFSATYPGCDIGLSADADVVQ